MTKFIAFLRAINVGGHTVKMDHLRALFESLGFSNVETFIASGNVLFESIEKNTAKLEKTIAGHLEKELGYAVDTFVRTLQELNEIKRRCPFMAGKKDDNVYVAFLHEPLSAEKVSILIASKNKFNDFAAIGREIYWLRLNRDDSIFLKSSLERILKISTTIRGMSTISKVNEKHK